MKLSKSQRAELKQKYGGKCAYCGCELGDKWHADHIEPVVRKSEWVKGVGCVQTGEQYFPENDNIQNMNPACQPCNNNKSTYSLESWRKSLNANRTTIFRDSSAARHLDRFGLLEIKQVPIVFILNALENVMCEYCEEEKTFVDDSEMTLYIYKNELRIYTAGGDDFRIIKFCPMCGKKLGVSDGN